MTSTEIELRRAAIELLESLYNRVDTTSCETRLIQAIEASQDAQRKAPKFGETKSGISFGFGGGSGNQTVSEMSKIIESLEKP